MIVTAELPICADAIQTRFLQMLPAIREQASHAFRAERPESKEELTAEVIANAFAAFVRLVERGKGHLAYATPLAQYAIRQVRAGRRVGTRVNGRDVLSPANRRSAVERLDRFDKETGEWQEVLVEDKHAGPAETAAARIDVAAWYRSLGRQKDKPYKCRRIRPWRCSRPAARARRLWCSPGNTPALYARAGGNGCLTAAPPAPAVMAFSVQQWLDLRAVAPGLNR